MSAQPAPYTTTRILIAEKSENAAYEIDSALRNAGMATKLSISDDLAHIRQLISANEIDIALLTYKLEGLENAIPAIKEIAPHVPLLLLTNPDAKANRWHTNTALRLGITDVVPANALGQLALVVHRELQHVFSHQHAKQLSSALTETERRCESLLQASEVAIAYVHEGMHIHANKSYLELFNCDDLNALCSASLLDLLSAKCAVVLKNALKNMRSGEDNVVLRFTSSAGDCSGTMALKHSLYEGEKCLQVTVHNDAMSSNIATSYDACASEQDLGLPEFIRSAEKFFSPNNDNNYLFCVSLDQYKATQQTYGLLRAEAIASKVWVQLRKLGGEYPAVRLNTHQFALAVTAPTEDHAHELANGFQQSIGDLVLEIQDHKVVSTISVAGVSFDESLGIESCLNEAYAASLKLSEQKTANTVQLSNASVNTEDPLSEDARIAFDQISGAIDHHRVLLRFQPIISLKGDSDAHYEVSSHIFDEHGKQIEPSPLLKTAIDNNLRGEIDRWVILQSIRTLSEHRAKGNTTRLTISLSANSVLDEEFPPWLISAMKSVRLPAAAVIFQITEKDATTFLRQTREFVQCLRKMHCRVALSGFGLNEEPFEILRHIEVDMIKLDDAFIEKIEANNQESRLMVNSIERLQASGKLTVVPMVENANILSILWQAGANYIQGDYLQGPSPEMDYDFNTDQ